MDRIDGTYLAGLPGTVPGSSPARPAAQGVDFWSLAAQLQAGGGCRIPAVSEESPDDFWEKRMESHKKFMELQQDAAAQRRLLMKLRLNGGSVSAAELLLGLL